MDVRCENCGTEYELDDGMLRPGGVTVRCTTCGHEFAIGRRTTTVAGPPQDRDARPAEGAPREPMTTSPSGPRVGGKERNWLIRLPTGEVETCRELATLQQWIISGRVTRQSGISRTGGTWKRLGDIKELSSFFEIAEEARRAARMQSSGVPRPTDQRAKSEVLRTLQGVPVVSASTGRSGPVSMGVESMGVESEEGSGPVARPGAAAGAPVRSQSSRPAIPGSPVPMESSGPVSTTRNGSADDPPEESIGESAEESAGRSASQPPEPDTEPASRSVRRSASQPPGRGADAWRGKVRAPASADHDGPQGPVGGLTRRAISQEPAFGGTIRPIKDELEPPAGPGPAGARARSPGLLAAPGSHAPHADDDDDAAAGAGAGRWVVLFSLVLMAGAAVVAYWFVFRDRGPSSLDMPADAVVDGGAVDPGDGGALGAAVQDAAHEALLARAGERLRADTRAGLQAILPALEQAAARDEGAAGTARDPRQDLDLLVALARVRTALAQHGYDAAAAMSADGDEDEARGLRRSADQQVLAALGLAQNALKLDRQDPGALVIMADILRLQGKPRRQIDRYLDQALARDPQDREARLVRALAQAQAESSGKGVDQAMAALTALAQENAGSGAGAAAGPDSGDDATADIRPLYRLALLDFKTGRYQEATQHTRAVLAAQPGHEGARALLERIRTAMAVDTSDPMPPEEEQASPRAPGQGAGSDDPARPDEASGDGASRGASGRSHNGSAGSDAPGDAPGDSYAALLASANRKRRAGQCSEAAALFERALDINPIGVEALTGMGYCHIEQREFASAHGKLRAALGVSPRDQDALWGMAEAYAKQGMSAKAIEWYQRVLDEHPNGSRADAARRQIERLGSPGGEDQAPPPPPPPDLGPEESAPESASDPAQENEGGASGGGPGNVDTPGGDGALP